MTFDHPTREQLPQLLALWKDAFGDWGGFWELFLETGFSPGRCRCVLENGSIIAALTWLDCRCGGEKMAYVYAVVTHPAHRGRGLCRALLADTHTLLSQAEYSGVLLVPAEPPLRQMYEKSGYEICTFLREFHCTAADSPVSLRAIGPDEYAQLRRRFLPEGGVVQEGESLSFLAAQAQFYTGADFLLAAYSEDSSLTALELLGNIAAAPGILRTLDCKKGSFRCPGEEKPFAMFHPLQDNAVLPGYFGFAFD